MCGGDITRGWRACVDGDICRETAGVPEGAEGGGSLSYEVQGAVQYVPSMDTDTRCEDRKDSIEDVNGASSWLITKFRDVHMLCYTYDSMERPSSVCIVSCVSCFRCGSKVLPAFTGSASHAFTASTTGICMT